MQKNPQGSHQRSSSFMIQNSKENKPSIQNNTMNKDIINVNKEKEIKELHSNSYKNIQNEYCSNNL